MQILFLLLHAPDGHEVRINPEQITALHSPKANAAPKDKLYDDSVQCLISLSDGKNVPVVEDCERIFDDMERQS